MSKEMKNILVEESQLWLIEWNERIDNILNVSLTYCISTCELLTMMLKDLQAHVLTKLYVGLESDILKQKV